MQNKIERDKSVDFIKGILITLMVYGHINHSNEIQNILVDYIYVFHMPIFLFLSGFYFNSYRRPIESLKITFSKILLPYIIFITIYLILLSYANKIGLQTSNVVDELSFIDFLQYIFIKPIGAYWFLHTLIVFQILIYISLFISKNNLNWKFIIVFTIMIILSIDLFKDTTYLSFLVLGLLYKMANIQFPKNKWFFIIVLIIFTIFSTTEIKNDLLIRIILVISIISVLMYLSSKIKNTIIIDFFAYLGRNTLIILLMHVFFINFMKLFKKNLLSFDEFGIIFSILSVIFTILFCLIGSFIFDKLDLSKILFNSKNIYSPFNVTSKSKEKF